MIRGRWCHEGEVFCDSDRSSDLNCLKMLRNVVGTSVTTQRNLTFVAPTALIDPFTSFASGSSHRSDMSPRYLSSCSMKLHKMPVWQSSARCACHRPMSRLPMTKLFVPTRILSGHTSPVPSMVGIVHTRPFYVQTCVQTAHSACKPTSTNAISRFSAFGRPQPPLCRYIYPMSQIMPHSQPERAFVKLGASCTSVGSVWHTARDVMTMC